MADIIIILDESGSMQGQRDSMIGSINEMISEQKKLLLGTGVAEERINVFIYRFSTTVKPVIAHPLMSFPTFTREHYEPDGGTALYDAIGQTLLRFKDSKNTTVLIIATDGQENSSKEYTLAGVKSKLEEKKAAGWSVIYLSENLDTKQQGDCLGVRGNNNVAVSSLCSGMKNCNFINAVSFAVQGQTDKYELEMAEFSSTSSIRK